MSARSVLLTVLLLATTLTLITHLKWDRHPELLSLFDPLDARLPQDGAVASEAEAGWAKINAEKGDGKKVALEIHIMSKCPDAKDCLEMLIAPAMEKIENIVDFRASFIGRPTEAGISCKHGPTECLGNAVHLCAAHLYDTHTYLPFAVCLTHDYSLLPQQSFLESCASQHGLDFGKLNDCISDIGPKGGMERLRKSVQRSRRADAEVSCTVRVNKTKWCIRDSGEWKGCDGGSEPEDLVKHVENIYKKQNRHKSSERSQGEEGGSLKLQVSLRRAGEWIKENRIIWRG